MTFWLRLSLVPPPESSLGCAGAQRWCRVVAERNPPLVVSQRGSFCFLERKGNGGESLMPFPLKVM